MSRIRKPKPNDIIELNDDDGHDDINNEMSDNDEDYQDDEVQEPKHKKLRQNTQIKKHNATSTITFNATSTNIENSSFIDYSPLLELRSDHMNRPIWITPTNSEIKIYLEAFHIMYQEAYDRLVAIAEPIARPKYIHTYQLTENSLYAAVALGITPDSIIKVLSRLCKTKLPSQVESYIRQCTYTFGKAKLVLKNNKYYIESKYPEVLRELLRNPIISQARIFDEQLSHKIGMNTNINEFDESLEAKEKHTFTKLSINDMLDEIGSDDEDDNDDGDEDQLFNKMTMSNSTHIRNVSFMIHQDQVQAVKKTAKEDSKYPLIEEYDFRGDTRNAILQIDIKPSTKIRAYQEKSLSKMFGNGRARSGIIVLPCGAGKSLTGVTAVSTIKKSCIVLCINNASVKQWKEQFLTWTNVDERCLKLFTSSDKDQLPKSSIEACIVITTYSMMCHSGKRSESGELLIQQIRNREWGLLVLDEVHVAPADMFQKVLSLVNSHCKLGLTATLVREDDKIKDLHFLVGPKLYEANWIDLTDQGFLAKVQCSEVWCPMTLEFYSEYIKACNKSNNRLQRFLYALNPSKLRTCEYLIEYHAKRYDKIIIFSDDVPALILYCEGLRIPLASSSNISNTQLKTSYKKIPYLYGASSEEERRKVLNEFRSNPECCCIGLSKVGDTALDIPEANVIIQISGQYGSRRQQAQRLGRILRPKANPTGGYNAFFYTLISTDTREVYFSTKRQQYLIDQGYTFRVRQDLAKEADLTQRTLQTKEQEIDLLNKVLNFEYDIVDKTEDKAMKKFNHGEVDEVDDLLSNMIGRGTTKKVVSNMNQFVGTTNIEYL